MPKSILVIKIEAGSVRKCAISTPLMRSRCLLSYLTISSRRSTFCEPILRITSFLHRGSVDDGRLALSIYVMRVSTRVRLGKLASDLQASNASRPFSLPMPLSFIPPLEWQSRQFSELNTSGQQTMASSDHSCDAC